MELLVLFLKSARGGQRFVIVAVALVPLLIFLLACVPAIIFVAFQAEGFERCAALADRFEEWTRAALGTATAPETPGS